MIGTPVMFQVGAVRRAATVFQGRMMAVRTEAVHIQVLRRYMMDMPTV